METSTGRRDAITTEIFANLFQAIVDEMAWIVLRSSHTTFVKETQDFSTGLVTPEGEMFAAPHASGATSLACISMRAGTQAFDDWRPGDVLMTNDPYTTSGMVMHLNDIYLMQPVFVGGELLCFAWTFIHCTDVGGYAPGSIDMQNHEVFQEGLRIRPQKLYRAGELDQQLWDLFADNCRIPTLNWGDITALVAALRTAEGRVHRLAEKYAPAQVRDAMYRTMDRTEELSRAVLREIPAGSYRFVEYFEDDYTTDLPVRLEVCLRSSGDGDVTLDFTGSDPQVRAALNLPTGGQRHHPFLCLGLIHFVTTRAEGLHLNAGLVRPIDLVLPEASVVNASFPAACGMRYNTALRIHELVMGALGQALPGAVPAGAASQVVVTYISTSGLGAAGRVVVANPVQGGSGGGVGLDGISGLNYGVAFLRSVPVEVLESEAPVLVHRFGLQPDTEGVGRERGGFGIEFAVEIRHPGAVVVMRGKDRHRFTGWGACGGGAGTPAGNTGTRPGQPPADLGKTTVYRARLGEVISLWSGGGGGFGSPLEREAGRVAEDCRDGLVSEERARDLYGVVLRGGSVDTEATERRRAELRQTVPAERAFDFGAAREAWEARYGLAAERIAGWLPTLPVGVRRHAQERVYELLGEEPAGPLDEAVVGQAIERAAREVAGVRWDSGAEG